ncbi:unnamed protein product [Peniophora sp. CBMAI 1063]|nr:unnamed protein product [Peniophora sp. CBMAI 1063]
MTFDWNDQRTLDAQYYGFSKIQHALYGIFLWELVNSLEFDLALVTTKRLESASSLYARLVYLSCRYLTLAALTSIAIGSTPTSRLKIDCKAWMICTLALSFAAVTSASTLIAIRAIAIFNRRKSVIVAFALVLTAQLASFVYEVSRADATESPANETCIFLNTETNRLNVTATFVTDTFLLVSMLFGLLRWKDARRKRGIWDVLWRQGIMWLSLATLAELPSVVFIWLNLNQVMNVIFFTPELIILIIGATRMYRALWAHDTTAYDLNSVSMSEDRSMAFRRASCQRVQLPFSRPEQQAIS